MLIRYSIYLSIYQPAASQPRRIPDKFTVQYGLPSSARDPLPPPQVRPGLTGDALWFARRGKQETGTFDPIGTVRPVLRVVGRETLMPASQAWAQYKKCK